MNRKYIITFLIILGILILLPVLFYSIKFFTNGISKDPNHWGVFGDYIGGILNPIIGLASIAILGYISISLGNNTTNQQEKLFLREQKILAYQELVRNRIEFHQGLDEHEINKDVSIEIDHNKTFKGLSEPQSIIELNKTKTKLLRFKNYMFYFESNYKHLFSYNFNSFEYTDLLTLITFYSRYTISDFVNLSEIDKQLLHRISEGELKSGLERFLRAIQSELN